MGGDEVAMQDPEVLARMDRLVATAAEAQRAIGQHEAELEAKILPLRVEAAAKVDPLAKERDDALDELAKLMEQMLGTPGMEGKSLQLRSGVVSVRTTSAIDILDEKLLMRLARRFRIFKQMFKPQPSKANKTMIGELLERRPELAEKLKRAVVKVTTSNMTVKPTKAQVELKRELHPLRKSLPESQ